MKSYYSRLMDILKGGARGAMVTRYGPAGIEKTAVGEGDIPRWDRLRQLLSREDVETDGPVSRIQNENGLTVIERYTPRSRMIILGGGHIALSLSQMAKLADFSVTIFDDRPMYANADRFPAADQVICDDFSRVFERVQVSALDYVVIVTRGHKHDAECLEGVLKGTIPAYMGMIGSRRRVAIVLKQLEDAGYDKALLDQIYTPIGVRIGGVTPAEISVSILAEVIQVKRVERKDEHSLTSDLEIARWLAAHGEEADALITILRTNGPVPRETGAKMAMTYEGRTINTIGGGCAESDVMQDARAIIREGGFKVITVDMTDTAEEDGMVCGGTMDVVVENTKNVSELELIEM